METEDEGWHIDYAWRLLRISLVVIIKNVHVITKQTSGITKAEFAAIKRYYFTLETYSLLVHQTTEDSVK